MYKEISDYGIVGNLCSVALVGTDGSIDWLCLPFMDSPSVFARILDDKKGGHFSISPSSEWDSVAYYVPDTNILVTNFRTRTGTLKVTDFMPVATRGEMSGERPELYRMVEVKKGTVDVAVSFEPRFNYALSEAALEKKGDAVIARTKDETLALISTRPLALSGVRAEALWGLSAGDSVWLHLVYGQGPQENASLDCDKAGVSLRDTGNFWKNWLNTSETGRNVDPGPYRDMVRRSALVLKLLQYHPTGAIAAAATSSLPEEIGGARNWDYRYTWIRDTSFTLRALFDLGHLSETENFLRWLKEIFYRYGAADLQIVYGLRGEKNLPEKELHHLDGYKGSRPVRIGNRAAEQKQLDIFGELMDAALKLSDYVGKIDSELWPFLRSICDHVVEHWREPDYGIWEVRGGPYQFVYSKVMCWVALDRGLTIARRYGFSADLEAWENARSVIRHEVLERGWDEKQGAFRQRYDCSALDAAMLLMPALGFLPYDDPRVSSNAQAIQRELGPNGFLYRYIGEDGLPGTEGTFLLCTFWLIDNLIGMGRIEEAEILLDRVRTTANHLGLFPEEYDFKWRQALGNFPQALTHIGYINSALALREAKRRAVALKAGPEPVPRRDVPIYGRILLNDGEPRESIAANEVVPRLKNSMNILRGAFFDTRRGRVAYEKMADSAAYREYVELSYALKRLDPGKLDTREQRLSFWINIYNIIVIHAVIELGIKDSVTEVRNFFKRVEYRIGGMPFTPDDVEHGILRGNRRPPHSILKPFGGSDPRLKHRIVPVEPRVHFTLVCASSSCPPIEVYTAENLENELSIAARTFLNTGGARVDREKNRVTLSRIFKWYGNDFGENIADRLRFIAPFLYDENDRTFLLENADRVGVSYQDYDWRLNRY